IAAAEARLRAWSTSRDTWLARQVRSLVDPERTESRAPLFWAVIAVGAAWLFLNVLEDVVGGDRLVRVDTAIYHALQSIRTPAGDALMVGITELGDTVVTTCVATAVFVWLVWRRAWRTALYWAAAVGFAATFNTIIKLAVHRSRPGDLGYTGASVFSFPSGHATVNAVLYGFLAFLIARQVRPAWRRPIYAVAASFAMLVAFSRLYLGAHWFSDVIGSLAFATTWLIVLGLAYVRHHEKEFDGRKLAAVACCSLALVGGLNVVRKHAADVQRYAVRYEIPSIPVADWLTAGWPRLPAYRVDLMGETEEPLNFVLAREGITSLIPSENQKVK
ncbi:MAG: phosphatase PAP2 family protein, partial [Xanthomonadaceae bacterium]|nr:phosphatase PAP2 family protein [Xanthomonadaceae bacterium]